MEALSSQFSSALIAILVIGGWIERTMNASSPLKLIKEKEEANRNEA